MTVSSTLRKAGPFAGNGVVTLFPFAFKVFTGGDLSLTLTDTNGNDNPLTYGSDYSVTLNSDQNNSPGGVVTYPLSGSPLPFGYKLTALGNLLDLQPVDLTNNGGFYPQVIEDALDRAVILIQQLTEITSRSVHVGVSDPLGGIQLPPALARADSLFGFDVFGNYTPVPITASVGAGDMRWDTLTAGVDFTAGVSTTVVLSRAPGTPSNVEVFFDGVFQGPDQIQSVVGNILAFVAPIPASTSRVYVRTGTTLSLYVPPDGSVTTPKLADRAVTDSKLAATGKLANRLSHYIDVTDPQYGADPTGVNDSTAAWQAALNAGGRITGPAGAKFKISSTLLVGNGSNAAPSTLNGIVIDGVSSGATASEVAPSGAPFQFIWAGAPGGTMMQIAGPIFGVRLSGLTFDCAGIAATAISFSHPINSKFEEILALRYTGTAYSHTAFPAPDGCVIGSSHNVFSNVHAKNPGAGGNGMVIGAATNGAAPHLDPARNTYIGCDWWRDGTSGISYGLALQFTDNSTFIECHTFGQGGALGVGLFVNPPSGATTFPAEIAFFNCPIEGGANNPGTWTTARGIGFFPFPTGDGEPVPVGPVPGQFYGLTSLGEQIGGLVVAPGNTRITQHTSTVTSLTYGAIAGQGSTDQTVAVAGAQVGDTVTVASTNGAQPPGCVLTAFVNSSGFVIVRWVNAGSASQTPGTASYRIDLWRH